MSDDTDERVPLTVEQALRMLEVKEGDRVHTFINAGGVLMGADWTLEKVRKCFEENGAEVAGEYATNGGHGVVSLVPTRAGTAADPPRVSAIFFATKPNALAEVAS